MEGLRMPSDAEMMRIAIDDLSNSSLSFSDRVRALEELLILVEPIDNANDLNKLGGLVAVIKELDNVEWERRKLFAWVLGQASQNNPAVQDQVLQLIMMVKSNFVEEPNKALYAVSALIRNNFDGQRMLYAEARDLMLREILSNSSFDVRLRKKSVFLIGDLAEFQLENMDQADTASEITLSFGGWDANERNSDIQLKGARWFSFEEIKKCTSDFSDANIIGAGRNGVDN